MKQLRNAGLVACLFMGLMLTACGGSGGGESGTSSTPSTPSTPANALPVANAGVAQNGYTDTTFTLDGSASSDANGDTLAYAWTLTGKPVGSAAKLSGAKTYEPRLTPDLVGSYTLTLVVNDGKADSAAASVTITAAQRFVKLDATGAALADSATNWSCVRDKARGLVWEVKNMSDSTHLRYYKNGYTNYDDTAQAQFHNGTSYVTPTQTQIDATTNSIGFKKAVNIQGLCGASDWRLPDIGELRSLNGGASSAPYINTSYFPDVDLSHSCQFACYGWFWSSSSEAGDYADAWSAFFSDGSAGNGVRSSLSAVRLVRAGQ